jgi:hypothetical protein
LKHKVFFLWKGSTTPEDERKKKNEKKKVNEPKSFRTRAKISERKKENEINKKKPEKEVVLRFFFWGGVLFRIFS